MQIQRVNSQQNPSFGNVATVRTSNFETMRKLIELGKMFDAQSAPEFRYLHGGSNNSMRRKEFFKGFFGDKEHKEFIEAFNSLPSGNRLRPKFGRLVGRTFAEEGGKPVVINKIEEILNLPIFANCREAIAKMIASINLDY